MVSIDDIKLSSMNIDHVPLIGILAIQGAVSEHEDALRSLGARTVQIRYPHEFDQCDGIVLPGGESTTMAIVGEHSGLFPKIKSWVHSNKPIWGTCAGMILLSDHAIKTALGGQSLVGGLDVHVCRNYFGSQINSCVLDIDIPEEVGGDATHPFPAVFIRAPAILQTGPSVKVLSTVIAPACANSHEEVEKFMLEVHSNETNTQAHINGSTVAKRKSVYNEPTSNTNPEYEVVIAVQKDNILATAFHPELTMPPDLRWQKYFLNIVKNYLLHQYQKS